MQCPLMPEGFWLFKLINDNKMRNYLSYVDFH